MDEKTFTIVIRNNRRECATLTCRNKTIMGAYQDAYHFILFTPKFRNYFSKVYVYNEKGKLLKAKI